MANTVFTFRFKDYYKDVDPDKCAAEVDAIGGPGATAPQILDAARDPSSELHKCFEWDDTIAAEKFRLQQAHKLLHMIVFKNPQTNEPTKIRVFNLGTDNHAYKRTEFILQHADEYAAMLERAIKELQAFKEKYKTLKELGNVFAAIDEL